jgi:hypothetical protein
MLQAYAVTEIEYPFDATGKSAGVALRMGSEFGEMMGFYDLIRMNSCDFAGLLQAMDYFRVCVFTHGIQSQYDDAVGHPFWNEWLIGTWCLDPALPGAVCLDDENILIALSVQRLDLFQWNCAKHIARKFFLYPYDRSTGGPFLRGGVGFFPFRFAQEKGWTAPILE